MSQASATKPARKAKKAPSPYARRGNLKPHFLKLVGHGSRDTVWVMPIGARRQLSAHDWDVVVDVVIPSRITTVPPRIETVLVRNTRPAGNLLAMPDWVIPALVHWGTMTYREGRSLNKELNDVRREANKRRNVTTCKATTAHGFRPYLNMGAGRLTSEHMKLVR